jgi:hypothetical protein
VTVEISPLLKYVPLLGLYFEEVPVQLGADEHRYLSVMPYES